MIESWLGGCKDRVMTHSYLRDVAHDSWWMSHGSIDAKWAPQQMTKTYNGMITWRKISGFQVSTVAKPDKGTRQNIQLGNMYAKNETIEKQFFLWESGPWLQNWFHKTKQHHSLTWVECLEVVPMIGKCSHLVDSLANCIWKTYLCNFGKTWIYPPRWRKCHESSFETMVASPVPILHNKWANTTPILSYAHSHTNTDGHTHTHTQFWFWKSNTVAELFWKDCTLVQNDSKLKCVCCSSALQQCAVCVAVAHCSSEPWPGLRARAEVCHLVITK